MDRVAEFPVDPAREVKTFQSKQDHTILIQSTIYDISPTLYSVLFVNFLQNVQYSTCTPCLRGTRVKTKCPVLVRQLG